MLLGDVMLVLVLVKVWGVQDFFFSYLYKLVCVFFFVLFFSRSRFCLLILLLLLSWSSSFLFCGSSCTCFMRFCDRIFGFCLRAVFFVCRLRTPALS